jgi:CMP-N-acetylneuraminic acid synthetase
MSEVLAIIPARGGSKRLPGKNVKPLAGLPLIAHTIRAALDALSVGRVVVSTDDEDIATVARCRCADGLNPVRAWRVDDDGRPLVDLGGDGGFEHREYLRPAKLPAKVHGDICPFTRPPDLATDTATSEDVVIHALDWLSTHEGYVPDLVVLLQATSPLRTAVDIECALRRRGVVPAGNVKTGLPSTGAMVDRDVRYMNEPRPVVSTNAATGNRNGAIYIASPHWIRTIGGWEPATPYPMLDRYSVDIDTAEDFAHAEWLMGQP